MKKILIVDDDIAICRLVAAILEEDYEVTYVTDLDGARRLLAEARFDLIIADYFLGTPESHPSSWSVAEACKALAPGTPIIALTGLDASLQGALKASGARAVVSKPFDMYHLLGTVGQAIA